MDKIFQSFQEHVQNHVLANIENRMKKYVTEMESTCFRYSQDNPEQFAHCMYEKATKTQEEMQKLEMKLEFHAKYLMKCVEQSYDQAGKENCLRSVKNSTQKMVDNMFLKF